MSAPRISVVIPSYNRRDGMLALLGDLRRQEGADFEMIVVDDRSPDDSVEAIRTAFPEVKLFVNEVNGGPSVTRNRGIREACGELIVGFDSDVTVPDPRLLAKVAEVFDERPQAAGIAFHLLKPDGCSEDTARWWHPLEIEEFAEREFPTTYFSGTAYAFRRDAVVAAGLYPEYLYMHYEEVELAWRVLDGGGELIYRPDLVALHHANPVSRRSEIEVFYKPRNQVLIAVTCLPLRAAVRYAVPRVGYQLVKSIRKGHLRDFLRAMVSAVRMLPDLLARRKPLSTDTLRRIRRIQGGNPSALPRAGAGIAPSPGNGSTCQSF